MTAQVSGRCNDLRNFSCALCHHLTSALRHNDRMFKLGGGTAVGGAHRPSVGPAYTQVSAQIQHRLNGEGHAGPKAQTPSGSAVVGHLRLHVHLAPDAMTAVVPHKSVARLLSHGLYRSTHITEAGARVNRGHTGSKRTPGGLDEPANIGGDLSNEER